MKLKTGREEMIRKEDIERKDEDERKLRKRSKRGNARIEEEKRQPG